MKFSPAFLSITTTLAMAGVVCLAPELALAQNSAEWVKPATGLIEVLRHGLTQLGVGAVGLFVMIRGFIMIASSNPDWPKIGVTILGAVMIMTGPAIMAAILESIQ